jgi:hypothetical protein
MKKPNTIAVVGIVLASLFVGESAFAGACQVLSSTWNVQLHCGLPSRGYGKGSTAASVKKLEAKSTGNPGAFSYVAAAAVDSSGALLSSCKVLDEDEDPYEASTSGGQCQRGVKFYVQVGY